jgi:hypothetical protein
MTTTTTTTTALELVPSAPIVTPEQKALARKTVADGATDTEFELYLYDCARRGVHPLDRLLHFTKRSGKYTPIASIDYLRTRAAETGECLGISAPDYAGTEGHRGFSARVTVARYVHGQRAEFSAVAYWKSTCLVRGKTSCGARCRV